MFAKYYNLFNWADRVYRDRYRGGVRPRALHIFRPNWGPKGKKKFFRDCPPPHQRVADESVQTPGEPNSLFLEWIIKIFIVAKRTRSDLKISRSNSGLNSWNRWNKPKSQEVTCQSCPKTIVYDFIATFRVTNYLGLQWHNRLILQLRVSSDLTGCRWVGSNPGWAKNNNYFFLKKNKRTQSDLEMSQTNSALISSNNWLRPKTHGICAPNLVSKKATLGHS